MATDRLVLISDVHVDYWEQDLPNDHVAKRRRFLQFFDWLIEESGAKRLVINGDLVDIPQQDGGPILPRYEDIAGKLREVVRAGIKLGYVIGNHDSGLVGLEVALPSVQVDYPSMTVASGDRHILIEHGHLQDPWLWDYVRTLARAMLDPTPGPTPPTFLQAARSRVEEPSASELSLRLHALWQARGDELDPRSDDASALIAAVQQDLQEDYSEVTDQTKDRAMLKRRREADKALAAVGVAPGGAFGVTALRGLPTRDLLERLVQTLYSGPHWRRVAKERAAEVTKRQPKRPITGVIMGHTHFPDEWPWRYQRRACHYINAGSWRGESADIVVIEDGKMRLLRRKWQDPWP